VEDRTAKFLLDATVVADGAKAVTENEDGDLVIEGLASDFSLDRQDEAFIPGAFEKGIKDFLAGQRPLLYHHKHDLQLGQVEHVEPRDDGLYFKAVVPQPPESSPLRHQYELIRRGMMKAVSVAGLFKRRPGADGRPRIYEVDLAEISVTPFPVNPRALFTVAQKAFSDEPADEPDLTRLFDIAVRIGRTEAEIERMSRGVITS
jgi:HK97 family phage prohead protease